MTEAPNIAIALALSVAVLAVALALVPSGGASADGPDYVDVSSFTAVGAGPQLAKLSATTGAPIPQAPGHVRLVASGRRDRLGRRGDAERVRRHDPPGARPGLAPAPRQLARAHREARNGSDAAERLLPRSDHQHADRRHRRAGGVDEGEHPRREAAGLGGSGRPRDRVHRRERRRVRLEARRAHHDLRPIAERGTALLGRAA